MTGEDFYFLTLEVHKSLDFFFRFYSVSQFLLPWWCWHLPPLFLLRLSAVEVLIQLFRQSFRCVSSGPLTSNIVIQTMWHLIIKKVVALLPTRDLISMIDPLTHVVSPLGNLHHSVIEISQLVIVSCSIFKPALVLHLYFEGSHHSDGSHLFWWQ